jgi:hypothetical protein
MIARDQSANRLEADVQSDRIEGEADQLLGAKFGGSESDVAAANRHKTMTPATASTRESPPKPISAIDPAVTPAPSAVAASIPCHERPMPGEKPRASNQALALWTRRRHDRRERRRSIAVRVDRDVARSLPTPRCSLRVKTKAPCLRSTSPRHPRVAGAENFRAPQRSEDARKGKRDGQDPRPSGWSPSVGRRRGRVPASLAPPLSARRAPARQPPARPRAP